MQRSRTAALFLRVLTYLWYISCRTSPSNVCRTFTSGIIISPNSLTKMWLAWLFCFLYTPALFTFIVKDVHDTLVTFPTLKDMGLTNESCHDKINKVTCAPSEDSDPTGLIPSRIRVFAVRFIGSLGPKLSSGGQRRPWSDWADAQADLSLRGAHRSFCWFCHEVAQMIIIN